ncbi:hypothetical protein [Vibrio sp. M260118]|uniref:hypothetical protein n=1 Tax=Vibrio sp. M260118 TaxID=3020896 RepID=UPI002F406D60
MPTRLIASELTDEQTIAKLKADIYTSASQCFYYLAKVSGSETSAERASISDISLLELDPGKFFSYNFIDLERKYSFKGTKLMMQFFSGLRGESLNMSEQDIYITIGKYHAHLDTVIDKEQGKTQSEKAAMAYRFQMNSGGTCMSHLVSLRGLNALLGDSL